MSTPLNTSAHGAGGHERTDAPAKYISAFLVGVAVLAVVGAVLSWVYVKVEDRLVVNHPPEMSPLAGTLPKQAPEPRLQASPARDYREYRAAEETALREYALIDEKGEVIRIPIERAMELIAQRGLPVRNQEAGKPRSQEPGKP